MKEKHKDTGFVFGCLGMLLWAGAIFLLPAAFFTTCIDITPELDLDFLLTISTGFVGFLSFAMVSDKENFNFNLPAFTTSSVCMLVIYSIVVLLIIGFVDIGLFSQQLAKRVLIYIIYVVISIVLDILKSKGIISGITNVENK